jgi:hypothetical protein
MFERLFASAAPTPRAPQPGAPLALLAAATAAWLIAPALGAATRTQRRAARDAAAR